MEEVEPEPSPEEATPGEEESTDVYIPDVEEDEDEEADEAARTGVAVVAGVLIVLIILGSVCYCCCRKPKETKQMIVIENVDTTRDRKILGDDTKGTIKDATNATAPELNGPGDGNNTSIDLKDIDDEDLQSYGDEEDEGEHTRPVKFASGSKDQNQDPAQHHNII